MTARRTWRRTRRGLTTSLALGVLLAPTAALAATDADPDGSATTSSARTCDQLGFPSENKVETRGGGQNGTVSGSWGSASWTGKTLSWGVEDHTTVELCVKYGSGPEGAEPETLTVTGSGSATFPRGISHVSWRDAVTVEPGEPGDDDGGADDNGDADADGDDNGADDNGTDDNGTDDNGTDDNGTDDNGIDDDGIDDDGIDDGGGEPVCVEYPTDQQATWLRTGGSTVDAGSAVVRLGDVPADSCDFPVNFSSYQLPGGEMLPFDEQVRFDNVTVTVGPGGADEPLEVSLPDCAWQTDLYTGPVLETAPHHTPIDVLVAFDLFTSGDGAIPCDEVEVGPDCVTYTPVEQAEFLRDAASTVEGGSALVRADAVPDDSCPFQVNFSSYELPGGSMLPFEDQVLHDTVSTTVAPGDPLTELLVRLPDCAWQTDLYTGDVKETAPHHLPENVLVAADLSEGIPCDDDGTDDDAGADDNGTDDNGTDDNGTDDNGTDDNGTDDNGDADADGDTDADDAGADGVDADGVDADGVDADGADAGADDNGDADAGADDNGADDNGADDSVGADGDQTDGVDADGVDADGADAGADDNGDADAGADGDQTDGTDGDDVAVGGVVIEGEGDDDGAAAGVVTAGDDTEVLGVSQAALPTTGSHLVPLVALALMLLLLGGSAVGAQRIREQRGS